MQRKCCEPNTYIDNLPKIRTQEEELYDDVDPPEETMVRLYNGSSLLLVGPFAYPFSQSS